MKERLLSWRLGALAALVVLVVGVVGAGVGESAFSGGTSASASTLVDGTTDTITNIDPAGTYDYGTFTLDFNVFEHLMQLQEQHRARAGAGDEVLLGRNTEDLALQPPEGRDLPGRIVVRLD